MVGAREEVGGGDQSLFLNHLCMSVGSLSILFLFVKTRGQATILSELLTIQVPVSIPLLSNVCAAFHIIFVFSNPDLHPSILRNLSPSLSRKLFRKLFFPEQKVHVF